MAFKFVTVAQMVERLVITPENHGSNPINHFWLYDSIDEKGDLLAERTQRQAPICARTNEQKTNKCCKNLDLDLRNDEANWKNGLRLFWGKKFWGISARRRTIRRLFQFIDNKIIGEKVGASKKVE